MRCFSFRWSSLFLLLLAGCTFSASPDSKTTNTITNRGSDTMVNLALAWAEAYAQADPRIQISVTGGGSGTGITALTSGTVDIANASRAMKPEEINDAKKNGVDPMEFIVARDAIAVIVNPANPVGQLTLRQVSDIFTGRVNNWQELGGENRPIVRVSREVNSGTHVYFLEAVIRLGKPDDKTIFAADTLLLSSSEGITAEVGQNPNAIGYDGLGYVTDAVKVIAIGTNPEGPFFPPSKETVLTHDYPISRDLYMYTNGQPQGIIRDYLDWVLGPAAQAIVAKLGFIPAAQ
jgi:phosphate transport system substrate-binding protein